MRYTASSRKSLAAFRESLHAITQSIEDYLRMPVEIYKAVITFSFRKKQVDEIINMVKLSEKIFASERKTFILRHEFRSLSNLRAFLTYLINNSNKLYRTLTQLTLTWQPVNNRKQK